MDVQAPDGARPSNVRWFILGPGIAATAVALGLYFLDVSGHEFFLFVAGLSGGMSLAELGLTLERGETRRHHEELKGDNASLRVQLQSLQEPALAAAVRVGADSVTMGASPDTEPAQVLGVSDELRSMADSNDVLGVTNFLSTRWGEAVSESFLLGRQLALLLLPTTDASAQIRDSARGRLLLRVSDEELADVVDRVLASRAHMNDVSAPMHARYIVALTQYLFHSTTSPEARVARSKLLLGLDGVAQASPEEEERAAALKQALRALVDAGVHQSDPDVLLLWGIVTGDEEIVANAIAAGAEPTTSDVEVLRRHRDLVPNS